MKKLLVGLLAGLIIFIPYSVVMADPGGNPNPNAIIGEFISGEAQILGGIGPEVNHQSDIQNTDFNGDGKTNGQDLAALLHDARDSLDE